MTSLTLSPGAHLSQGENQELWTNNSTYKKTESKTEDSTTSGENNVRSEEVRVKNMEDKSVGIPVPSPEFKRDLEREGFAQNL